MLRPFSCEWWLRRGQIFFDTVGEASPHAGPTPFTILTISCPRRWTWPPWRHELGGKRGSRLQSSPFMVGVIRCGSLGLRPPTLVQKKAPQAFRTEWDASRVCPEVDPPGTAQTGRPSTISYLNPGKGAWGITPPFQGQPSSMTPTGTPKGTRMTAKGSTGPDLIDTGLTGPDTIWTDITVVIRTATVFSLATTSTMFRRHVRPLRVSMDVDQAWSVGGSAGAAGATPRELCVPGCRGSWQVRRRRVVDEKVAILVPIICCWCLGFRSRSPARVRGAVGN